MTFEEKIEKADELLEELINETENYDYFDGDGYWVTEYTCWCNRYFYDEKLVNVVKLKKLVKEYSEKIPELTFYYVQTNRKEDESGEIGYQLEDLK